MTATEASPAHAHPLPSEAAAESPFTRLASGAQLAATVAALERNGFRTIVAEDRPAAVRAVLESIPEGAEVLDATSQTLAALGLPEILSDAHRFHPVRPDLKRLAEAQQFREGRKLGAAPDVIVGSVHAITEQGQVVIASATGSQLGPYAYGAGKVVWVVGTQKIVPDLDAAIRRIAEHTLPLENARAQKVYGVGSFVAKELVVHREFQPGRITIVLVRENLGF